MGTTELCSESGCVMRIEHIAIWTKDMERLKAFYTKYFGANSNQKYINDKKQFESYFLSFSEGCRIEIMQMPAVAGKVPEDEITLTGLAHFAVSVGSRSKVIALTEMLRTDGYKILSEPRTTGDGYFESVIGDPDGNKVEITI